MNDFVRFLSRAPTVWHAAREITSRLAEADFTPLGEKDRWHLEAGKGYFVMREGAVCAFRMPKQAPRRTTLVASHTDSPALKIKPKPELNTQGISQFSTEVYGGPLLHTWLDRDLCLSGQVASLNEKGRVQIDLVHLDDYPLIIPGIPPHLERTLSEKGLHVHKQDHLKAIFSIKEKPPSLNEMLHKHLSCGEILSFDLFLVPTEKPQFLGAGSELLAGYRIDNLSSAYASLKALIDTGARSHDIEMAIFWDHEEIGSTSYTGARSYFVDQILERICLHCKMEREDFMRLKANSLCISADVAHGYHPNYAEKFDLQNAPKMGQGVVIKFNADQKYASSSHSAAPIVQICKEKKIPYQLFASRSDIPSGSTVGSFMAANLGMPTVDLGAATWAMHSVREVIAIDDQTALTDLLKASYEHGYTEEA
ncbi:MAG: M18 family aminopeptidase [Verrucomicrobia bacterium]|nr:M18 family aminopeptidase [Verrucomicrobiota bacterium]